MKRLVSAVLVFLFTAMISFGQGLDDEYVQIFRMIQEADSLSTSAPSQALAKYLDAQAALDRLHKGSPDWNQRIVNYRLTYLASRIGALSANSPLPQSPQPSANNPSPAAVPQPGPSSAPADWQAQLNGLREQTRQAQSDKELLEAKLKEALALRPAAADPAGLAKAEQRIKELQKENDLLRVAKASQAASPAVDAKAVGQAHQSLAESRRQLDDQTARVSKLTIEKEALEARLKSSSSDAATVSELRSENQLLKQKLAQMQTTAPAATLAADASRQLAEAKAQLAMLQSSQESLRLEKTALESKLKQLSGSPGASGATPATPPARDSARVKQLESERDSLQRRLDEATQKLHARKEKGAPNRVEELENQLAMARMRMEILDSRAVPYSAEELELLKAPKPKLAETNPRAGKKSIRELPAGAATLVAEAQRCFAAKQYDKAEAAYLQVLQQDPKNVPTLGNLAVIQVEAGHLDKAEANIKQALSLDPEDPYSLYVLGILRFRQAKYDEALDALAHSAKLDPQNAEVQNYLGLTLSEKGMRIPAEAALRKAIELKPDYAGAQYNLAVIYATQQPRATALARWHYQKAIAAGYPRNPDLEKKFEVQ